MSADRSARLGLPYLAAGQMQKHVTLNEALTRLDALVQAAVLSRTTTGQPAAPQDGDLYILPDDAIGAVWSAQPAGSLMRAEDGGWTVVAVQDGMIVLVQDADELLLLDDGDWLPLGQRLGAVQALERFGLGTTADAENPFAAKLNKALWTALETSNGGDGDLRFTFNKETDADVLSLLFQSGWSGRAELGLVGDDDLTLKVSADGSLWREVIKVDRSTGRATFSQGAGRRTLQVFTAYGTYTPPVWARSVEAVVIGGGGGGGAGAFGAAGSRFGGGGGGAGGISRAIWSTDKLTSPLTVVVGAGGTGGTAGAGAGGSGSSIYQGSLVLLSATGGGGGGLGTATSGAAGSAGFGVPVSNSGGASSVTAAAGPGKAFDRVDASGGGGAGGGLDSLSVARSGGGGGDGGVMAVKALGGGGGAGAGGQSGAAAPMPDLHWAAGGGGGGGASATGSGWPGGPGGGAGAGGGGGGAGLTTAGAGGGGATGLVWLIACG